jgi:putative transposase
MRRDYLHKSSSILSKNQEIICVEDLQVKNMSKSAKGTIEKPGRNVKAKSGLNKAILDHGWGELTRQLSYKQHWSGGILVLCHRSIRVSNALSAGK